jgi:hypothetical protein
MCPFWLLIHRCSRTQTGIISPETDLASTTSLIGDLVETQSGKVRVSREHVQQAVANIRRVGPRFVCVIHSKVRDALNRQAGLTRELDYGVCGNILPNCDSQFVLNYFPNGNAISDAAKLEIFRALKKAL